MRSSIVLVAALFGSEASFADSAFIVVPTAVKLLLILEHAATLVCTLATALTAEHPVSSAEARMMAAAADANVAFFMLLTLSRDKS